MIIGLTGPARSGKDTVARFLAQEHGFEFTSFAAPIRQFVANLCGISVGTLEGMKDIEHPIFEKSPRVMMQTLGTEWGRNLIHPEIWAKIVEQKILDNKAHNTPLVVTDVRFDNEADLIRSHGGTIWSISRHQAKNYNVAPHSSENGIELTLHDKFINNDKDLRALQKTVADLLVDHYSNHVNSPD